MIAISRRAPSVTIEYTRYGKRVTKTFINPYEARTFYQKKFCAGKKPCIFKVF